MLKIWNWKDGMRTGVGSALVSKDLIKRVSNDPIAVGPKDPTDPEGKRRIKDIPDSEKTHYLIIKFFTDNPKQRPNFKGDAMEDVPYHQVWVPAAHGEAEFDHYCRELGVK